MSEQRKSILDKLFECVNNGVEWGVSQVKNPCPPREKFDQSDSDLSFEEKLQKKTDAEAEFESKNTRIGEGAGEPKDPDDSNDLDGLKRPEGSNNLEDSDSPEGQSSSQDSNGLEDSNSKHPGSDTQTRIENGKRQDSHIEKPHDSHTPCPSSGPYLQPEQICPTINEPPCCVILMQDPCRPCCCEPKNKLEEPCPPRRGYLDEPRESVCSCDFCRKGIYDKSYVEGGDIFSAQNDGTRLERA